MVYELRDRKENLVYRSNWCSSEYDAETDNYADDAEMASVTAAGSSTRKQNRIRPQKSSNSGRKTRARLSYNNPDRSLSHETENFEDSRTILSWLIDLNIIENNEVVSYNGGTMLKGKITKAGILCTCCEQVLTVLDFELHAKSDLRRPYQYIEIESNKKSLLKCLMEACQGHMESARQFRSNHRKSRRTAGDQNDDSCMICADGGDLMCCDKCPSTFHFSCMNMERIPEGEWFCPYCVCKHCGLAPGKFLTCSLCEKKFHWSCPVPIEIDLNLSTLPFCSVNCREIFEKLEQMVGIKTDLDNGYSWTLLKREGISSKIHIENSYQQLECNAKITVAGVLMDQCFETIIDRYTGINVVRSVINSKGSNLRRINFAGFYIAILVKDEEVISAASIRIHGREMAEMPFVATDTKYRGQGFLRKLLVAVESALNVLNVENLVIPSSREVDGMWTQKFNFSEIECSLTNKIASSNTLMFPKAVRLQKRLLAHVAEEDGAVAEVDVAQNDQNAVQQNSPERLPLIDLNLNPSEELIDV